MKKNYKIIIYIFLIYILKLNNCQLIPPTDSQNDIKVVEFQSQSYTSYPTDSTSSHCLFNLVYSVVDYSPGLDVGLNNIDSNYSNIMNYIGIVSDDQKSSIVYIKYLDFDSGEYSISLLFNSKSGVNSTYHINLKCNVIDFSKVEIQISGSPKFIGDRHFSILNIKGLEHTNYIYIMTNQGPAINFNDKQYLILWNSASIEQGINDIWRIDISFESKYNYSIIANNPYRDIIEIVSITDVKRYPLSIDVSELGDSLPPIMTFKSNSTKRQPYQINDRRLCTAISGTQGDMLYATVFSNGGYGYPTDYNFTFQSELTVKSFINTYSIAKFNPVKNNINAHVAVSGDQYLPIFSCKFTNSYYQTGYQFVYLKQTFIKRFPFGFISGSNLDFSYSVVFQRSFESPVDVQFDARTELLVNNFMSMQISPFSYDADTIPPTLESYSFIQISSISYLLRLTLSDRSGISNILFDYDLGIKGSSKLVSGDIYNGTYEIIFQTSSILSFEVFDYNNNVLKLSHGQLLNINPPFIFNVPNLLLKDIGYSDFTDFQFAENDLNLNDKPSHNVLYFNLTSGYPRGKPVGFILGKFTSYEQIIPIVWNETIQMYNVKFIVPKNIQFGYVDWSIIPSERALLSCVHFPDSYQLRIASSYLDNYGPIFTGIQYLNDTSLPPIGWKLRIKDDFNGFSSGYIRVFGAVDNTNYNFNFTINDVLSGGSKFDGFYNIHLPNSATLNIVQDYIMTYVSLVDSNNIESLFSIYKNGIDPIFNPFINFLKNPEANVLNINEPTGTQYSTSGDSGQPGYNPISTSTSTTSTTMNPTEPPLISTSTTFPASTTSSGMVTPTRPSVVRINDDPDDKELYVEQTNDSGFGLNYNSKHSTSTTTGGIGSNNQLSRQLLSTPLDPSPPTLIGFSASKTSIDVGSKDRTVTFNFEATDPQSGLKSDQYPIVYLIGKRMEILECVSKIEEITTTNAIYNCSIELPIGWGYPGALLISVYGFINNGGSYGGSDTTELLNQFSPFHFINTTMSLNIPLISSNVGITSMDKELIIYGKSFGLVIAVSVEYYNEIGDNILNETSNDFKLFGNSAIILSIKPNLYPIIVYVNSISGPSNLLKIFPTFFNNSLQYVPWSTQPPQPCVPDSPTPSPTPSTTILPTNPPIKCTGNPECGGPSKGYCRSSGCVCLSPWVGNDCLSQVIIIPQPPKNSTSPTIEIPIIDDGSNNSNEDSSDTILFKSLISILSIRELDFNGRQIKLFQFDKWIFTEINDKKNQYQTSITTNSPTESPITTNITVELEWFKELTFIQFADSNLTMNPSTVKYTIEVTEYPFSSSLNSLQLIMSASFESSKKDICSTKEFGLTSSGDNSNYLKIQIDNHSLYGRFIKRAIIDNTVTSITNEILDNSLNSISTSSKLQSFIGITIPNFKSNIIIDPDFSVLLDHNHISNDDNNSICNSSSGLTIAQLAGIIVGSIAFASVIAIAIVYYIIKKKQHAKFMNSMQSKLKNIKNN